MRTTRTFYDFASGSKDLPIEWAKQATQSSNVIVYIHPRFKCWCREIRDVRGEIRDDGWFYPDPGQLVGYRQAVRPDVVGITKGSL